MAGDDTDSAVTTATSAAIQPDGRIVVAGASHVVPTGEYELPHDDFALARYTADGSLDTSFGTGGRQTTDFGFGYAANDAGVAVAIQADGKIVVAGWTSLWTGRSEAAATSRSPVTTPNGSPDTSFGAGGALTSSFSDVYYDADDFSLGDRDPARRQDRGGGSVRRARTGTGDFALARYQGGSGSSGTAPTSSSPPTISGTATEGQALTVNSGAWTGSTPINRSYQWRRCDSAAANCVDIAAATATTYSLAAADVGHAIRVRETATNTYGQSSVDSAATAVVKAKPGTIAGTVRNLKNGATIANASVTCGSGYSARTTSDRQLLDSERGPRYIQLHGQCEPLPALDTKQ